MTTAVAIRPLETRAISQFLAAAAGDAAVLVLEGEPGIGKTTLLCAATDGAAARGYRVLSTRATRASSALAYGAVAELLRDADAGAYAQLPIAQLAALDQVVMRSGDGALGTDPRAIAAGVLSILQTLAETAPTIVALDDVQWLDPSSIEVLGLVLRRLSGRIGIIGTVRAGVPELRWLQPARPERVNRIGVLPLGVSALHTVLTEQLSLSFDRSTVAQIHQISGGNPFFAIELARAHASNTAVSGSLTEIVARRIGQLSQELRTALLITACLAAPTVDLVARAMDTEPTRLVALLAAAHSQGFIETSGDRIAFAHPLLARGVYREATAAQRTSVHRRLADLVEEPELKARHFALGEPEPTAETFERLDAAATAARTRGAPAAAAELLSLAIELGGGTPQRRLQLAMDHFNAGDPQIARGLLTELVGKLPPGALRAEALGQLGFVHFFDDSFTEAVDVLGEAMRDAGDDPELRTRLLITLPYARYNAAQFGAAAQTVAMAVEQASARGQARELSQALRMQVLLGFLGGAGLDEQNLARAMQLDDKSTDPIAFRPSVQNAMLMAWSGRLDHAHTELETIRRHCMETGQDSELVFVASHSFLVEVWRGNFAEAELIAEDTAERAAQLGGDVPLIVAHTLRATLTTYAGDVATARRHATDAIGACRRAGANLFAIWPISTLGFLEVSLGEYEAALTTMQPLLRNFAAAPAATEIIVGWFIPHAVEAFLALDRVAEAEPLVAALENNGRRFDRAWMLAAGGRCRAMLLERADPAAALAAAEAAMAQHARIPMPFEKARTQLVLGRLQRGLGRGGEATATLSEALATFDRLGIRRWAERARSELAQGPTPADDASAANALTRAERRVAELAATGMTNLAVADALSLSPTTVEATLSRAHRKLGTRSADELRGRLWR